MTDPINDGGPVFPREIGGDPANNYHQTGNYTAMQYGMSLRDHFAGLALPVVARGSHVSGEDFLHPDHFASAAFDAYAMADAMLRARAQAQGSGQ